MARMPALFVVAVALTLAAPAVARADLADERALAERFAPVVRLVEQEEECGPGEPWEPTDVDVLFDEPTVALRGPWNPIDLVKIGPSAEDLVDRFDYHLDFPGNPLHPAATTSAGRGASPRTTRRSSTPTSQPIPGARAGRAPVLALLSLQRLQQPARGRLGDDPARLRGGRRARGARRRARLRRLQLARGRRGSRVGRGEARGRRRDAPGRLSRRRLAREQVHGGALHRQLGRGGVGCDDTRGPHVELRPEVETIPSDADAARRRPTRGSRSRAGGASSSRRSSTARRGRT